MKVMRHQVMKQAGRCVEIITTSTVRWPTKCSCHHMVISGMPCIHMVFLAAVLKRPLPLQCFSKRFFRIDRDHDPVQRCEWLDHPPPPPPPPPQEHDPTRCAGDDDGGEAGGDEFTDIIVSQAEKRLSEMLDELHIKRAGLSQRIGAINTARILINVVDAFMSAHQCLASNPNNSLDDIVGAFERAAHDLKHQLVPVPVQVVATTAPPHPQPPVAPAARPAPPQHAALAARPPPLPPQQRRRRNGHGNHALPSTATPAQPLGAAAQAPPPQSNHNGSPVRKRPRKHSPHKQQPMVSCSMAAAAPSPTTGPRRSTIPAPVPPNPSRRAPPPPQNVAVQCGALCLASGAPHEPHTGTHTTTTAAAAAAADPPGAVRVTATTQNSPPPAAVSPAPQPAAHTTPSTCSASYPTTTATASSASSSRRVRENGLSVQCGGGPSTTPPVPQPACAHAPHHSTATQCGANQLRSHHRTHQQPQKPPGSSTT